MVNNSEFVDLWVDDGKVWEKKEWPSEQAQQQVKDSQQKAKQIQAQIQQGTKHNQILAQMLEIILDWVKSDDLLANILDIIMNKSIEIKDVFIILLPFIKDWVHWQMQELVDDYLQLQVNNNMQYYDYIKNFSIDSFSKISKQEFADFIIKILYEYDKLKISNNDILNETQEYQNLRQTLISELYN